MPLAFRLEADLARFVPLPTWPSLPTAWKFTEFAGHMGLPASCRLSWLHRFSSCRKAAVGKCDNAAILAALCWALPICPLATAWHWWRHHWCLLCSVRARTPLLSPFCCHLPNVRLLQYCLVWALDSVCTIVSGWPPADPSRDTIGVCCGL